MGRIINIASAKGGVGKTTVAINLGIALTKYFNKKVALIDCNLTTAHIGLYLGMYSTPITLNSVLRNESSLAGALYIHPSGLRIVPASLNLQDLRNIDDTLLRKTISDLSETFDIVLLDSAPGIGKEALMAVNACNEVLFIANPFIPSIVDVAKAANICQKLNSDNLANIKLSGVVLNRVKEKDYELAKEEIEKLTTLHVIDIIPEDEQVLQAVNSKIPVILSNSDATASKDFIRLAANLIGEKYIEETPPEIEKRAESKRTVKVKKPHKEPKPEPEPKLETKEESRPTEMTEMQETIDLEKELPSFTEKTIENPVHQIEPFETKFGHLGLTEGEEKINEQFENFIREKGLRKLSFWGKVKSFFLGFRR